MPYILPDPGLRPLVMVPPEHVDWMVDQSDSVLSARKTQVGLFFFHRFVELQSSWVYCVSDSLSQCV